MIVGNNQHDKIKKAVRYVQAENPHHLTPNPITSQNTLRNNFNYRYTNLNGVEIALSPSQLIAMAREFVHWTEENPKAVLKQTFWNARGITMEKVFAWAKAIPEFGDLIELAGQNLGTKREEILMNDYTHLRSRQAIYVPEYKQYDIFIIELKERVKQELEKQNILDPKQIAEVIRNSFFELGSKEKANAKRNNRSAKTRRQTIESTANQVEQDTFNSGNEDPVI